MTECAGKSDEEMASAFIVSTCQLHPKSFPVVSDHMFDLIESENQCMILCGSVAEFYIRPANTCIDDLDFLIVQTHKLVFSGDFPVLPSDISGLSDMIVCYKIESYDKYPGFVRLRILGELNYNWTCKKYVFRITAFTNSYAKLNLDYQASASSHGTPYMRCMSIVCGPAIKHRRHMHAGNDIGDIVQSVWCPQWPKEAQEWLQRPRNNGWPTIDTITEVAQNGCHFVYIQHRSCRADVEQWRFSFSLAEVVLLQSWTQIQQIVYHLLRFFAKRELIQKDCPKEDEVLCPYHLKTLMLWTCEEMPSEWWNSSSVIAICCELLKKLSEWLKRRHYPNYFIPEANLFHEPSSSTILDKTELRITRFCNSGILCNWFVENYIEPYTRHFKIISTMEVMPHFVDYMLPLFEFWKVSELESLELFFLSIFAYIYKSFRPNIKCGLNSGLPIIFKRGYISRCFEWKVIMSQSDLPTIQNVLCFTYYELLLIILHTAFGLGCGEISLDGSLFVEFVNAISRQPRVIRSMYHNFLKTYPTQSSRFKFLRAQDLMENLIGSNSRSEFQLLSLMSKEFLRRALEKNGSNEDAAAAFAYLAALHFATSEYQLAIRFCLSVFVNTTSQKENETLNAGCLLFIDDVARISGLCVLLEKIINNNLHSINKRLYLDLRLSPKVFAHYLTVLSAERMFKRLDLHREFPDSTFPMDEYLKALTKPRTIVSMKSGTLFNAARQIVYRRTDSLTEAKATDEVKETVIDILMECALENMTSFYSVLRKDFGIQCNTTDCYRALYLYKCRQYDDVLHLCERILHEPDLQNDLKECAFANVWLFPPLDSFFDRHVQSLLGFHNLFYYVSPLIDDLAKVELTEDSTFEHRFAHGVMFQKPVLSCFLQCHYSTKCHYFLGKHFLARYLRVRCCIDSNLPYREAMTVFAAQISKLPFEIITRRFLLRKLRLINE